MARIEPGKSSDHFSRLPPLKKSGTDIKLNQLRAHLVGPLHSTKPIENEVEEKGLYELIDEVSKKMARAGVKTDFIEEGTFPDFSHLREVVEYIQGIQNPTTKKEIFTKLLGDLYGRLGKENMPPDFEKYLAKLAGIPPKE